MFLSLLFPLPEPKPYSLLIEDRNGRFLHAFLAADDKWRLRTAPDAIPERLKRILIMKEDKYFYYHPGVNPCSLVRALVKNIVAGKRVSGASTITMQVARMLEPKKRTYFNKFCEIFRSFQLELRYSKKEILEMYLSMIPLGGNIEGISSAAYLYYGTPPERLNIAQLFDLILIPNDPNRLNPTKHPAELYELRKQKARPWVKMKYFSAEDSIIIAQTGAGAVQRSLPRFASHFCLRVREVVPPSPVIRSSLDRDMQKTVETLLRNHMRPWSQQGVENGAVIVIENSTGEIVAYTGSPDFDDALAHGQVNAAKALRSPGSTLKPFLYAMEMERGTLTPKTRLIDTPYDVEGYNAENYNGQYSGLVYADEALQNSLNVPMIRLLHEAGISAFVDILLSAGMRSLEGQREKLGLSMIIGGCGVTLEELTAAYTAFPAGGRFAPPSFVHRTSPAQIQRTKIFSASTAYMLTEILSGIDRPDLPNNFQSAATLPRVAFKTGTSYGRRDAWTVGYSARYTVGVWVGNVNNHGNANLAGGKAAAPLLIDIFNTISPAHEKEILPRPKDLFFREVCATSGHLPTPQCKRLIEDEYSVLRTQDIPCEIDREYLLSPDGSVTYCMSCLGNHPYHVATIQEYPPDLISFWERMGAPYKKAPRHNPECTRLFTDGGPRITSPSDNMTYYLVSRQQQIVLQASSGIDVTQYLWYLDDRFLRRARVSDKPFLPLGEGDHRVTCVDDKGRMTSVSFKIRFAM